MYNTQGDPGAPVMNWQLYETPRPRAALRNRSSGRRRQRRGRRRGQGCRSRRGGLSESGGDRADHDESAQAAGSGRCGESGRREAGGKPGGQRTAAELRSDMVLLKEYRVILPVSVDEYQVGQLYSVAEASKNETGGGEGVEVLVNEPYEKDGEKGQYTHKIYHLQSKVPTFVRMLAPEGALNIHEKAWNAYPYCRTGVCFFFLFFCFFVFFLFQNEYMKEDFLIKIETWHKPDLGTQENVHKLEPETWKHVEAVYIDIADRSQVLSKQERRLFTNFHRQLFCWLDKWVDLTMDDIRRMEEETKRQLDEVSGIPGETLQLSEKYVNIKATVMLGHFTEGPAL
ncbi:Phosphatidylinositol transfer protein alpha isoform [Sciurus carolinensis]|uniref:Phosphatidylinositol transfer protein alpha isoform n=1 Tax=Sciurus carolinensis TaxID=30640 RepID=A0AA41NI37_SCICA|nr:Phosphatidylinositol transfer protein alpha isoform [Sciurus carolinensis]